jgi:hypothetical protein
MARYDLHHAKSPLEVSIVTGQGAEVVEFIAKGTIVAGTWVDLDAAGSTTGSDRVDGVVAGAGTGLCIGVALEAASAASAGDPPNMVRVCISGYVEGAKTDGWRHAGSKGWRMCSESCTDKHGTSCRYRYGNGR